MHRVELKVSQEAKINRDFRNVPNAPCGVESYHEIRFKGKKFRVPNAPCGVESFCGLWKAYEVYRFLMHRVELKANPVPQHIDGRVRRS